MPFEGMNFGLSRPTVALENPMDIAMKQMAMQNQQMQLAQQQQAMQDAADFRQLNGMSPGLAKATHEVATARMQSVKAAHEAQKSEFEQKSAWASRIAQLTQGATDQESYSRGLAQAKAEGIPGVESMPQVYDPAAVKQLGSQALQAKDYWDLQIKQQNADKDKTGFKGFHAGADQVAYQVNDATGQAKPIMGPDGKPLKVAPSQTAITLSQMNSGYDGTTPLPKGMEVIAKAIAAGDQDMMTSARTMPRFADINARAAVLREGAGDGDPLGKSAVAARAAGKKDFEPQGTTGKTISAINTMTEHLATAKRMAGALQNGDVQAYNRLANALGVQVGKDAATNFATIKQFLAGEVAKVATGGHITEGEIRQASERLSQAQSPAQLMGALDTMREVAAGKLLAIDQDHKRLFGKSIANTARLTPNTLSAFKEVNAAHEAPKAGAKGAASVDELLKALGH